MVKVVVLAVDIWMLVVSSVINDVVVSVFVPIAVSVAVIVTSCIL